PLFASTTRAISRTPRRFEVPSARFQSSVMGAPVNKHAKFPREVLVPFLIRSSFSADNFPDLTSNRQPSGEVASSTGSTHDFVSPFEERRKEETSGTMAPLAAGSGDRTVRAQSHAITAASEPLGSFALGYI